jgi:hypothetical protein
MTGKKDQAHHDSWQDHADESGRFFTCKGMADPPLDEGQEGNGSDEEGSASQGGLA